MTASLLPSSLALSWGPSNDKKEAPDLLPKACQVNRPERRFVEAGLKVLAYALRR